MRKILFALLCLVSATCVAQAPFEMGAIKIDSVYFNGTSNWVDSLVTNAKLPSASDQQIPSAKAVKAFVVDTVSQMIHDSISAIAFTSTSLSDSIDKHTDTLQLHNTKINTNISDIDVLQDTVDVHNTRLKALENGGGGGGGVVDTTGLPVANQVTYFTAANKIGGSTKFTFDGDSVRLIYLDPVASGTRFLVLTATAALDSGVLNPVKRGLEDKLWDITKHLADRKNGEIKWVHIDDITGDTVSTYGLPQGMDAFEALQYTAEMSLRLLAEQDSAITKQDSLLVDYNKRLALLERKQIRMTRQDYKYKAKLLKLENRLK